MAYRAADNPDRMKALGGVVVVHAALAAIILSGLSVHNVAQTVERLKTFDITEVPPPPPPPPPMRPTPERAKDKEGAAAKKALPTPVVAPPPRIVVPYKPPVTAARIAVDRQRGNRRGCHGRQRDWRRRVGQRAWRRRQWRFLGLHPGADAQQDPEPRISPPDCRQRPDSSGSASDRIPGQRRRHAVQLPDRSLKRRRQRRSLIVADAGHCNICVSAPRATATASRSRRI